MEYRRLGRAETRVSAICLGTMTWGQQNTEAEAHRQLDLAFDRGVNFLDTAEMYPVPPRAETAHRTEEIIGTWLAKPGNRARAVVATKVAGRAVENPSGPPDFAWIRGGPRLDAAHIAAALDASLARLRADRIDLYQLHWPERRVNNFGALGYAHAPRADDVALEDTLEALARAVEAGKVGHVGLSNETPWGVMRCVAAAETGGLPRPAAIQNPYSLLNRAFENGLAEIAHREDVGLLAYSPLGGGVLSGKYLDGARPPGSRLAEFDSFRRYSGPRADAAVAEYAAAAREAGLDPARMALAFVTSRPFVTSNIIGATTMTQLESNLASADLVLPPDLERRLDEIHDRYTYPCP